MVVFRAGVGPTIEAWYLPCSRSLLVMEIDRSHNPYPIRWFMKVNTILDGAMGKLEADKVMFKKV